MKTVFVILSVAAESVKSLIDKLEYKAENTFSTADIIYEFENKGGWWEGQNESGSATIMDGKYFIEAKKAGVSWHVTKEVSIDTNRDFSIESQLRFVSGAEDGFYGVIWGRKDSNHFHFFGVSANGSYGYMKYVNGSWSYVVSARPSQAI